MRDEGIVVLMLAGVAGFMIFQLVTRRATGTTPTRTGDPSAVESALRTPFRIALPAGFTSGNLVTGSGSGIGDLFVAEVPRPTRGQPIDFTQPVFRGIRRPLASTLIAQKREFDAAPGRVLEAINPLL